MPARPVVFALGTLLCLAGVITCATAPDNVPHAFPSLPDGLMLGGVLLTMLGVASREPRGRQLLGRRARGEAAASPGPDRDSAG